MKPTVMIVMAVAIGACSDNVATNAVPNNVTNVSGQWSYNATDLSGAANFSCAIQNATMLLAQSRDTLTGTVTGGTLSCQTPSGITLLPLPGGAITNSGINGNTLQINFGSPNFKSVGTVSGNSVFGQVAARGILGATAELIGKFSMVRQ